MFNVLAATASWQEADKPGKNISQWILSIVLVLYEENTEKVDQIDMKKDKEKYFPEANIKCVYSHCLFFPRGSETLPELQSKALLNRCLIFKLLF